MGGYVEATWGPWEDAVQREFFAATIERGLLQVIEVESEVAGLLEVDGRFEPVYIQNIEIAPKFQRRGIGGDVLGGILAEAGERAVSLQVLKVNPARRLYERLGFIATGETETHIQMEWRCGP